MAHRQDTSAPVRVPPSEKLTSRPGTFTSLRHSDYRYLWAGSVFANTAEWLQQITLGWLVWELSRSPFWVGVVGGMRGVPSLVMGPIGGVAADRLDRRKLLMGTQIVLAVVAVLFAAIVATGRVQVWHILVFAFITGCGFAVNTPVRQSLVANTVPRSDLGNAIALNSIASAVTRVIGPAAGGLLIVTVGAAGNFFLQAGLLVGVVVAVFPMKTPYREAAVSKNASPLRDLREGFGYIWGERMLFVLMMLSFVSAFFVGPLIKLLPVVTDEVLHSGASMYGYLVAAYGVGGLVATIVVASAGSFTRSGRMGIVALMITCVAVTLVAVSRLAPLSILLMGAIGFFRSTFNVNNKTLVQSIARDEMRGRALSIYSMNDAIDMLANFGFGFFAGVFSASSAVGAAGVLGLIATVALMMSVNRMREMRQPQI